jgi:hypothetical protein
MATDTTHRDLALLGPVTISYKGNVHKKDFNSVIIPGDQIRSISLKYHPDPGAEVPGSVASKADEPKDDQPQESA